MEDLRKLQLKELEILKSLKKICAEHDLTYYLAFGTLLGAVRHKGFIPWDDDVDVMMPVRDMEKLEQIYQQEKWPGLFLQTPNTDPAAKMTYFKLRMDGTTLIIDKMAKKNMHHGINIDIHPLCNTAIRPLMWKLQYAATVIYLLLRTEDAPANHGAVKRFVSGMLLFLLRGKARERLRAFCYRYMTRYEGKPTGCKAVLSCNPIIAGQRYPQRIFEVSADLPFEDDAFSVPVGYDEWLTLQYGNYMELPPAEKQGCKLEHIVKLDTEHTYLDYKGKYYLCDMTEQ